MLQSFYSAVGNRPQRLSAATRKLAARALDAEFGKTLAPRAVEMNKEKDFWSKTRMERYNVCARRIAETAPIRLISPYFAGSATLARAREHILPACYNGEVLFSSVSHLTPGFDRVLAIGFSGLRAEITARLTGAAADEAAYIRQLLYTLDTADIFHKRTLAFAENRYAKHPTTESARLLATLAHVPENPPRNFYEALESLWFMFAFLRLLGNWPAIGRIDYMLGPYLERDMASGAVSRDQAREWLAHFMIMGCEWITGDFVWGTGDAQHYQNIVLGGTDADGNEVCNAVTELVLEVVEELSISDFPIALRVTPKTPDALLYKVAEVTAHGGGVVAVYNDKVCVQSLVKAGIPLSRARSFANDGCWEIQVPGETNFTYTPVDILGILNRDVLRATAESDGAPPDFADPKQILRTFRKACDAALCEHLLYVDGQYGHCLPSPAIDLFVNGCIDRAHGYFDGGPNELNLSFHAGGMADAANAIYAIQEICFKQKRLSCAELIGVLRKNWDGQEPLRQFVRTKLAYFGNDNDGADDIFAQVYDLFVKAVNKQPRVGRVRISPGVSTFGREIEWRNRRGATAFGAFAGEILATNIAPSPGTDFAGATALLRSSCKVDYTRLSGSTAVQLRLSAESMRGADGLNGYVSLMKGFIREGGFFLQTDVLDKEELRRAQENPDAYRNLSVRVSGWSARFVTLNKEWQEMVIAKNAQQ